MNMSMTDAYSGFTIDFSRMNINEKSLLDMQRDGGTGSRGDQKPR